MQIADPFEETLALAENDRHEMEVHLVHPSRRQVLARRLSATRERDVEAPGGLARAREPDSMPSVTNVKVVPPSSVSGSRG